jgi:hypothetical protein
MSLFEKVKGLFHSAPSVSSPIGEMTERTAKDTVSPFLQSLLSDVCIAIMNNKQLSSSSLSKEELERMLTQITLVISASYQSHAVKSQEDSSSEPKMISWKSGKNIYKNPWKSGKKHLLLPWKSGNNAVR